ncbi:hypothetical protein [Streptomyces sp. NBC_01212]|uniref:hypothetical protein n=1 Tax=Streptomyces sp. NBC_01212 TaxID=2903775 RepID=UPI002E0DA812|nr:hypothetical protein OG722_05165 [Streptomyces sp. NBC_01212]
MDLLDFYRGGLSIRRLRVLIDRLPPESLTKVAIRNAVDPSDIPEPTGDYRPDQAPWSTTHMLLATLRDEIALLRSVAIAAAGGKPPDFKPMPRPGIAPTSTTSRGMTDDQRRALDPRMRNQP